MIEMRTDPYINDILHSKGMTFEEHIGGLEEIPRHLKEAGMQVQVNLAKSKLCAKKV